MIPSNVTALHWEVRIADHGDSAIHAADVAFGITNVRFHGLDSLAVNKAMSDASYGGCDYYWDTVRVVPNGIHGRVLGARGLDVAYDQGLTFSYAFPGAEPVQVDVRRVDGVRVASFSRQAAVADHLRLPVALTPGTYLVNVRSGPAIRSARLAVVR